MTGRAIVVGAIDTGPASDPWIEDLEHSLRRVMAPVVIHRGLGYADQTIRWAAKRYEEFIYLPQTAYVKDPSPLDQAFGETGMAVSLADDPHPFAFHLGKYLAADVSAFAARELRAIDWPVVYSRRSPYAQLGHFGQVGRKVEDRHGFPCRRVENEWLCLFLPETTEPAPRRGILRLIPGIN